MEVTDEHTLDNDSSNGMHSIKKKKRTDLPIKVGINADLNTRWDVALPRRLILWSVLLLSVLILLPTTLILDGTLLFLDD